MDRILDHIQALTGSDLEELMKFLKQQCDKTFGKNVAHIDAVLSQLKPAVFSLAYAFILNLKGSLDPNPSDFITQASELLLVANPLQIAFAPRDYIHIAFRLHELALSVDRPVAAVKPLRVAITALQRDDLNRLTSLHAIFIKLCLKSKLYNYAASLLDVPIYTLNPKHDDLRPDDYLSYFYYGGMVYIGLKKFDKALDFFQVVLTTPSSILSGIQVRAFQKYVLTCLLCKGELIELPPKLTSSAVLRSVDKFCSLYVKFASSFHNLPQAQKFLEDNKEAFRNDTNLGLAKQCITSWIRRNIQRLTSTFFSLSLSDIAERTGLSSSAEAEKHVIQMIADGQIYARINQSDGVVSFQDDPERYDTTEMLQKLDSKIREATDLSQRLKKADKQLQLDHNYIKKSMNFKPSESTPLVDDPEMAMALQASLEAL